MNVATINPTTDQLDGEKLLWPYPQKGVIVVLLLLDCVTTPPKSACASNHRAISACSQLRQQKQHFHRLTLPWACHYVLCVCLHYVL